MSSDPASLLPHPGLSPVPVVLGYQDQHLETDCEAQHPIVEIPCALVHDQPLYRAGATHSAPPPQKGTRRQLTKVVHGVVVQHDDDAHVSDVPVLVSLAAEGWDREPQGVPNLEGAKRVGDRHECFRAEVPQTLQHCRYCQTLFGTVLSQ